MTAATLQEQARALGDPTRHAIFRSIAEAERPIGVAELNERFPFNHNAIRQHLAKLTSADLIVEARAPAVGRGRPRLVYAVNPTVEGQWGTTGPYERLSRLLVEVISTGLDAEEVGRRAADQFRILSPSGDVVADVTAAMARQGFEPEVRTTRGGAEIVLHRCPFATAAVADRATICALHLGIAEGLTDDSDTTVTELVGYDPRKADCRLRLRVGADDGSPSSGTLTLRGRGGR
ncbi:MAG: helix-turn-helix transcriptional regulator [Actinomycetota bacterium]